MNPSRKKIKKPLAPLGDIDRRLIKHSSRRLVLSGETFELYDYEKPYFYNWAPEKKSRAAATAKALFRRRDNLITARSRIRRLINTNKAAWGSRLKFITYTFAKNISDLKEANLMWAEYMRRMRTEHGPMKYLAVVEFQKRGAIHYHVLFFNLPFIYGIKEKLSKMWGHGFVKVVTVQSVRNIGAYVSKYLQKEIMDTRLVGEKAFFCSKGLKQPREYRAEGSIAKIIERSILKTEVEKSYSSSHFGAIHYKNGTLKKHHHGRHN